MAQVNLKKVTKKFSDGTLAVDSISLEVADREFLVLVGPSGCGKSTTLRSIAGLETPDAGTIQIGEVSVNEMPPKDRNIAMVFQNYALYPHMSVYKNLSFGLNLRFGGGLIARVLRRIFQPRDAAEMAQKRSGIDHQVRQAAERLGIDHLLDRKPHQLSGGERQRVALGRAIVRNPAAFLFDEPLSNLDAKLRQQMRVELKRLHRELQATMIYVTHDQVEAMTLGDRVAVMNRGKIMQVGRPLDVYQQPANLFVARFIGSVPINLWRATVRQQENRMVVQGENSLQLTLDQTQQFPALSPGSSLDVIMGVRSENLRLVTGEGNVRGKVVAVDRLGESAIVHVDPLTDDGTGKVDEREDLPGLDSNPFGAMVVRAESMSTVEVGQEVSIGIDSSRVNWFDRQTGENLLKEEK